MATNTGDKEMELLRVYKVVDPKHCAMTLSAILGADKGVGSRVVPHNTGYDVLTYTYNDCPQWSEKIIRFEYS
jgi:hypothetical protein